MNDGELQVDDFVKATMPGCTSYYGMVAEINGNLLTINLPEFIIYNLMTFKRNECMKITPQEYFKQALKKG